MSVAIARSMDPLGYVQRLVGYEKPANAQTQAFATEKLRLTDALKPSVEEALRSGAIKSEVKPYTTGATSGTRVSLDIGGKRFDTEVGAVPGTVKEITPAGKLEATARALSMLDNGKAVPPEVARFTSPAQAKLMGGAMASGAVRAVNPVGMILTPAADYVEAGRHAKDPSKVREYVAALEAGQGIPLVAKMHPELDAAIQKELQAAHLKDI